MKTIYRYTLAEIAKLAGVELPEISAVDLQVVTEWGRALLPHPVRLIGWDTLEISFEAAAPVAAAQREG